MLNDWERQYPGRIDNMHRAFAHVVPSHLMDHKRHDFKAIKATGIPDADGDLAFDAEEIARPAISGLPGLQVVAH